MRNADKYKTAESRADAYNKYCYRKECSECKLNKFNKKYRVDCCMAFWLELEAEEEDTIMPCPFCGGAVSKHERIGDPDVYIECKKCGYRSRYYYDMDSAIDAHNIFSKAAIEAKKEVK